MRAPSDDVLGHARCRGLFSVIVGSSRVSIARVVTKEDVGKPIVLLGAWVRAGNGTDGSKDRHPSIASLRITSNPRHGALYWRAKPVLEGDAVPAEMGWERCSEASSRAFADAWPVGDPPLATLEWPCDVVVNANAPSPTHAAAAAAGVVVQPICAEVLYAPDANYHNWPSGVDALGNRRVPGSNPTRDEAPDAFGFEFDLVAGDASAAGGAGGGADAMRSSRGVGGVGARRRRSRRPGADLRGCADRGRRRRA